MFSARHMLLDSNNFGSTLIRYQSDTFRCQSDIWSMLISVSFQYCVFSLTRVHWLTHWSLVGDRDFKSIIFKFITQNSSFSTHCKNALRRMPQNLTNKKSTLVQVMALVPSGNKPFPSQSWPRYLLSAFGITRPDRVNVAVALAAVLALLEISNLINYLSLPGHQKSTLLDPFIGLIWNIIITPDQYFM